MPPDVPAKLCSGTSFHLSVSCIIRFLSHGCWPQLKLTRTFAAMEASISLLSRHQASEFFSNNIPVTQQQCNQEAQHITGASSSPPTV